MTRLGDFETAVGEMVGLVPADFADEAISGLPARIANELAPLGVKCLAPRESLASDACACDGYYEKELDPDRPWILYRRDVSDSRVRFTLMHELAHHLIWSFSDPLLDYVDLIAGPKGDVGDAEEQLCHYFAAEMLMPTPLVDSVIGAGPVRPNHVIEVYERSNASWEAAAVRVAQRIVGKGAVVIIRNDGEVSFSVPSPSLRASWPRGSTVAPDGPLSRALRVDSTAQAEIFRFGLPGADTFFCDTRQADGSRAIAVMSSAPSDKSLNILPPTEPAWSTQLLLCEWCGGERIRGWCDSCKGKFCDDCDRCGCGATPPERRCEGCGEMKPASLFEDWSDRCVDC